MLSGDWDDVVPAARVAASRVEMAVVSMAVPADDRIEIELVAVGAEPGSATFIRTPQGLIGATCRIGRFGDADRESRFLAAFERRLGQLRGVDYAPVR